MNLLNLLLPKAKEEERARKEFIINILLASSIVIIFCGTIIQLFHIVLNLSGSETYQNNAISFYLDIVIILFLFFLYFLSRKGYFKASAILLLSTIYILSTYMAYIWGVDLPASVLFFVLIVVMSGILISSFFSFISTIIIILTISTINYFQRNGVIETNNYWRLETWTASNIIVVSTIFLVIAITSWLSNKETEKSLARAKRSEKELKLERDMLEIKVEERTKELKKSQAEKMTQFYQFAEYGKLASGLFHDLINPLTAVSLNIEKIKKTSKSNNELRIIENEINRTTNAIKRMAGLINLTRKQFSNQKTETTFSLNEEIKDAIEILSYKIRKENIEIVFNDSKEISLIGNPIRFNQIATNLISNAIDSYQEKETARPIVKIVLSENNDDIEFEVIDYGSGIPKEMEDKIFNIFTTKEFGKGSGVGLYLTKDIIEKEFKGKIKFKTISEEGSSFVVSIPKNIKK